jgi:hypothetical protein
MLLDRNRSRFAVLMLGRSLTPAVLLSGVYSEHFIRREGKHGETEGGEAREMERWEGRQGTLYTLQAKLFGEHKRVRKRAREKKSREGATENDPSEKNYV